MKSLVAGTAVVILLLVGSTQLPPSFMPELTDSVKDACAPLMPGERASNERLAGTVLKTLSSAQADFRANDRDCDGVNQFWRADVAGLYALTPPGGAPLALIQPEVAAADDRPRSMSLPVFSGRTFHGYRFRAIRHHDESPNRLDPQRFVIIAYPATRAAGKWIILIDENNSLWARQAEDLNGIEVSPTDNERKTYWRRWG